MKQSIRTKFNLGMIFLFLIILVLSVFSGYYLNKLSAKTSAILKENYLSVVYARDMSEGLINISQEVTSAFFMNRKQDSLKIRKDLDLINKSLIAEKNNITEPDEDKLVSGIESDFNQYRDSVLNLIRSPESAAGELYLQSQSGVLQQKLLQLSEMNGTAIEMKTDDAKASSNSALTQMTILASLCFLIGFSFIFSFSSYFNQRFFQLYYGIKEIVSSNYDQRLNFDGKDEFYEISLVLNEMAGKLKENESQLSVNLHDESQPDTNSSDSEILRKLMSRLTKMEAEVSYLIEKFEKK
jgi:two-component system, NtrC family, sensor histidine kinase KinB